MTIEQIQQGIKDADVADLISLGYEYRTIVESKKNNNPNFAHLLQEYTPYLDDIAATDVTTLEDNRLVLTGLVDMYFAIDKNVPSF
ncbi:MAG: hypothetical protein QM802_20890 [Agriterribacter sp.]